MNTPSEKGSGDSRLEQSIAACGRNLAALVNWWLAQSAESRAEYRMVLAGFQPDPSIDAAALLRRISGSTCDSQFTVQMAMLGANVLIHASAAEAAKRSLQEPT